MHGVVDQEQKVTHGHVDTDLAQTILHLSGVPRDFHLRHGDGRPIPACRGTVIPALFA